MLRHRSAKIGARMENDPLFVENQMTRGQGLPARRGGHRHPPGHLPLAPTQQPWTAGRLTP